MKYSHVPVVILAGGLGTRLGEETTRIPKPMVRVGDRPLIWHIMKIYNYYGFNRFIICLGYKSEVIKEYFYNYSLINNDVTVHIGNKGSVKIHHNDSMSDIQVTLAETGLASLTGSRIKRIEKYVNSDTFLLTYGDGVADINIMKLLEFHNKHGKTATVTGIKPPARFGNLVIKNNLVTKFAEKPESDSGYINGGYFVFNKEVFSYLSEDETCILEKEPLENLAQGRELMVYKHSGFWRCVDTPRELILLNNLWDGNKAEWKVWK